MNSTRIRKPKKIEPLRFPVMNPLGIFYIIQQTIHKKEKEGFCRNNQRFYLGKTMSMSQQMEHCQLRRKRIG